MIAIDTHKGELFQHDALVDELAKAFNVSKVAMTYRINNLGQKWPRLSEQIYPER